MSLVHRAVVRLLAALLLAAPAAHAQLRDAPWGPNQTNAKELEVRVDALPDTLSVDALEIVVELSDEYCVPRSKKVLGLSLPVPVAPGVDFYCAQMNRYLAAHSGPVPLRASRQTWAKRSVTEHVRGLDVDGERRYLVLSRWRPYDIETNAYGLVPRLRWVVEELVWDRGDSKVLWHALRSFATDDVYEKGTLLGLQLHLRRYFAHTLPDMLTQRGLTRGHAPVPGSRWVAPPALTNWQSSSQGAVAFLNQHVGGRDRRFSRSVRFRLRPAVAEMQPLVPAPWASEAWMRDEYRPIPQMTLPMDAQSHALLELPPGRYVLDPWQTGAPALLEFEIQPGQLVVISHERALVGADGPVIADRERWLKTLARGRHAFLADDRVLPEAFQVETWFTQP